VSSHPGGNWDGQQHHEVAIVALSTGQHEEADGAM
jgi:hypothetical protein